MLYNPMYGETVEVIKTKEQGKIVDFEYLVDSSKGDRKVVVQFTPRIQKNYFPKDLKRPE